jgi:hypothetical protein
MLLMLNGRIVKAFYIRQFIVIGDNMMRLVGIIDEFSFRNDIVELFLF